jgi:hypothetical protein
MVLTITKFFVTHMLAGFMKVYLSVMRVLAYSQHCSHCAELTVYVMSVYYQ